jgi:hypothetical protein
VDRVEHSERITSSLACQWGWAAGGRESRPDFGTRAPPCGKSHHRDRNLRSRWWSRCRVGHGQRKQVEPLSARNQVVRHSCFALAGLALATLATVTGCGDPSLTSTTGQPLLRSSTTTTGSSTTSSPPFEVPACLGVVQVRNSRPTISLEDLLLTFKDVPNGYSSFGPQTTGAGGPEFTASFPSTVPVAYVSFDMTAHAGGVAPTTYGISETIGEEDSTHMATQLVGRMKERCPPFQMTVALPGSVPGLLVEGERTEGSRGQFQAFARLLTTKGPFVIDIRWSREADGYGFPTGAAGPPPFPTPAEMGLVADEAIAHIPG